MGISESKRVSQKIEQDFKSVRKYYDDCYGEMTVIEEKNTKMQYAQIEKILPSHDPSFQTYIKERLKKNNKGLINLHRHFSYDIDLCSGNQQHIFIMEYLTHTLYQEITNRQQKQQFFSLSQLLSLFEAIVEAVIELKKKNQRYFVSSSWLMYQQNGRVKGVENILSNKNESWQADFFKDQNYDQFIQKVYLSPEAFLYFCRKQYFKAKDISMSEPSLIFTLGVNFLSCALLADISDVYQYSRKVFSMKKLVEISEQVHNSYGNFVYGLICRMIEEQIGMRPNLKEVRDLLKGGRRKYEKKEGLNLEKRVSVTLQFPY